MTEVFVLLCCDSGCQDWVTDSVRAVPGVVETSAIAGGGAYDIMVRISAGSMAEAKSAISSKIKRINGVKASTVLIRKEGADGKDRAAAHLPEAGFASVAE
jgi:DNA-binding Lrp family transcriptional regulator